MIAEYFTAGPLLIMRWAYKGDEEEAEDDGYIHKSDSWEISISNDTMTWEDDDIIVKLKKMQ